MPPYMAYTQNMVDFFYGWSWRRLQNWKNEKNKKSLMSLLLSPFIYFLNEKKFIFKYLNRNL